MWWQIGATANVVVALAYFAISATILRGLARSNQLGSNRLATATGVIFFTCAVGHGLHGVHLIGPGLFGLTAAEAAGVRASAGWHMAPWDVLTALVGCWYLSLRAQYSRLLTGPVMFTDLKADRRKAMELNDDVVQGLALAKYALAAGDQAKATEAVDRSLVAARAIITTMLGDTRSSTRLGPGDLVRDEAAMTRPSSRGQR